MAVGRRVSGVVKIAAPVMLPVGALHLRARVVRAAYNGTVGLASAFVVHQLTVIVTHWKTKESRETTRDGVICWLNAQVPLRDSELEVIGFTSPCQSWRCDKFR